MYICDYKDCTGCFACKNICPVDAISSKYNEIGVTLPKIDYNKCISCGMCLKVCPVNNKPTFDKADCAIALSSIEEYDRLSSSGGVAAVMSRYITNCNGAVYGAAVVDKKNKHIRVTDIEETELLRGSKYVQSDIDYSYRRIKEDLENDLMVLFIGTPCQVAGLLSFLKKVYKNLITVDLICHGTPPHLFLEEHLNKICKSGWDYYTFRGKYDYYLTVYNKNQIVYKKSRSEDQYFSAFQRGMIQRENCYKCPYAKVERVSDVTIGDFWGLDRKNLKNEFKGKISVLLPNTEKGFNFFNEIKDSFIWEKRTVEEAANPTQGQLLRPVNKCSERTLFLKKIKKCGFDKAIMSTSLSKQIRNEKIRNSIIGRGFRKVKRILKIKQL